MEITEMPTQCLVCTDDAGHRVTTECDNPACEDGFVWPDRDTFTIEINGAQVPVPLDAVAWKHNDPTEDARWIYDHDEARRIESEDPSLIVWAH